MGTLLLLLSKLLLSKDKFNTSLLDKRLLLKSSLNYLPRIIF